MNKKYIYLAIFSLSIIFVIFGIYYFISHHNLTIKIDGVNFGLLYRQDNDKKILVKQNIKNNEILYLEDGRYCFEPLDKDYETSSICVNMKNNNKTLEVNLNYSDSKLNSLLQGELSKIRSIILSKYSPLLDNYNIDDGKLYQKGEWYGTTLTENSNSRDRGDVYKLVMKKNNDEWSVVSYPRISLNIYDYPQVPTSILSSINQLSGSY